jgi:hypothetical protein
MYRPMVEGKIRTRGRPMSRDRDMGRIAFCRTESIGAQKLVFAAQCRREELPNESRYSARISVGERGR